MRSHGATRFPDPTAQGQLTVAMVEAQGIDVHSPVFLRQLQSCLPASHGLLTPAGVANAQQRRSLTVARLVHVPRRARAANVPAARSA
jgi:hypothetical protein